MLGAPKNFAKNNQRDLDPLNYAVDVSDLLPTQSVLNLITTYENCGNFEGSKIAIVDDINSRFRK